MSLENFGSGDNRIIELPQLSTEKELLRIGAEKEGDVIIYRDPVLGIEVYWTRLLDEYLEETIFYVLAHQRHMGRSVLH